MMSLLPLTLLLLFAPPQPVPRADPLPAPPAPPHYLGPARGGSYEERAGANRAIEHDVDRGTGRISDPLRYEFERFDLLRNLRDRPLDRTLQRELVDLETDRTYRIDAKQLAESRDRTRNTGQQREAEMKLKEYELYVNAGVGGTVVAQQAENDRLALQSARSRRDEAIKAARGMKDFEQAKRDAKIAYQKERARILGFAPAP